MLRDVFPDTEVAGKIGAFFQTLKSTGYSRCCEGYGFRKLDVEIRKGWE